MASVITNYGKKRITEIALWGTDADPIDSFRAVLATGAVALDERTHYLSEAAELAAGNGYTQGGATIPADSTDGFGNFAGGYTIDEVTNTTTLYYHKTAPPVWTASGGDIGPFRYLLLVEYDPAISLPNSLVIGVFDFGTDITIKDGFGIRLDKWGLGW